MSFFLRFLPFWISFPFTSLFHLLLWRLTFLPSLALSLCVSTSSFLQFSKFSSSGSLFMSLTEHIYTPRCPPLHLLNSFQLNFLVKLTDTFEVFQKLSFFFFNWGKKWFNNKDMELRFCPWVFYPLGFLVFEVFSIIIFGYLWIGTTALKLILSALPPHVPHLSINPACHATHLFYEIFAVMLHFNLVS